MDTKKLAKIMKALSNPNRLELFLEIIRQQEKGYEAEACYISDIMSCMKIGAPTVSHHLKELSNADLIITERKGKFLVAKVNERMVGEVNRVLSLEKLQSGKKKK